MTEPERQHYPKLYCRKCEGVLSRPRAVPAENLVKYRIPINEHGAIIRCCMGCCQLWLGYIELYPKGSMKIIMKMIDKVL
jgi:hypothetical protein